MINTKIIASVFILLIMNFSFASAQAVFTQTNSFSGAERGRASFVNFEKQPDFQTYYRPEGRLQTYFPILGESQDICRAREDFVIQLSPAGCQPAVVRSDLLAEQNVPVFCQLDALQINPFIDVERIKNIRFTGELPSHVVGVGFHPARAALRTRDSLLGNPILNNVGYVVVVLKKQPDEKLLPELLNFKLKAQFEYNSGNALGIGKTEFLLNTVGDEEWESERSKQSFFDGRFSARLIDVDSNIAVVRLYQGEREYASVNIENGKLSNDVYLPGLYCQGSMKIRYDGFVLADKTARVQVDSDVFEVAKGTRFLNNKCVVRDISGGVLNGSVDISCGSERFVLSLKSKALKIGSEVSVLENDLKRARDGIFEIVGVDLKKKVYSVKKNGEGNSESEKVGFAQVRPVSENILFEREWGAEIDENFYSAIQHYKDVVRLYPENKQRGIDVDETIGEKALVSAIELAEKFEKEETRADLLEEFISVYPTSARVEGYVNELNDLYAKDTRDAGFSVTVDNELRFVSLVEVREPKEISSAEFIIDGNSVRLKVGEQSSDFIGKEGRKGRIKLESVSSDNAVIIGFCGENNGNPVRELSSSGTIRAGNTKQVCGENVRLVRTEVNDFARISIEPNVRTGGMAEVDIGIGIEKRSEELSPGKISERVDNLAESIEKWELISEKLGNVVTGLQGACLATAGALTVYNFFTGLSGESLAREKVMQGKNGWTEWCKSRINANDGGESYNTMTQCYNAKSDEIGRDVESYAKALAVTNDKVESIENVNLVGSGGGIFSGQNLNVKAAREDLLRELKEGQCSSVEIRAGKGSVGELLNGIGPDDLSYTQMRDLYFSCIVKLEGSGSNLGIGVNRANAEIDSFATMINGIKNTKTLTASLSSSLSGTGIPGTEIPAYGEKDQIVGDYFGGQVDVSKFEGLALRGISTKSPAQVISYGSIPYLMILEDNDGTNFRVVKAFELEKNNNGEYRKIRNEASNIAGKFSSFRLLNARSYANMINPKEAKVKYFESEPYKGMPAIVPLDEDGWYVATKQTLPGFGNIKAFDSNGRPASFWLCNVMEDGNIGFNSPGLDGDKCVQFNLDTGQPLNKFPGLSEERTEHLVRKGVDALNKVAEQHGKFQVRVGSKIFQVGNPIGNLPGTECQDFMSPEQCKLLFNVCDPVICPVSRCNLGGTFHVDNVIQSGIIGSIALCLPNIQEGILAPVCLTGVKAGVDGYLSLLKQHQACLRENLETGRNIGICDAINSVYTCEFFWRQTAPVVKSLLPKAFSLLSGSFSGRGGGEYLTVNSAWENAKNSLDFFTQSYGVDVLSSYNIRSFENAGSEFCRAFVSAKAPASFETILEPKSPPQFHAWYSEIPFTDATVPATSQYKVFYHIFAGNQQGASYIVYLKDPPELSFYQATQKINVASGFVKAGESVSETRDFTFPQGYKQLCVLINNKEECGFKQVSSSFALDYLKDSIVADELGRSNIDSESECISGGVNPSALLNPNIGEIGSEVLDPSVYSRGIVRICATENPGASTEPERFVNVGHCGDPSVGCWLDKESADDALTENNEFIRKSVSDTLSNLQKTNKDLLDSNIVFDLRDNEIDRLRSFIDRISKKADLENVIKEINNVADGVILDEHKAELLKMKGDAYATYARKLQGDVSGEAENTGELVNADDYRFTVVPKPDDVDGTDEESGGTIGQIELGEITSLNLERDYNENSDGENYILTKNKRGINVGEEDFVFYLSERSVYFELFGFDQNVGDVIEEDVNKERKNVIRIRKSALLSQGRINSDNVNEIYDSLNELVIDGINLRKLSEIVSNGENTENVSSSGTGAVKPSGLNTGGASSSGDMKYYSLREDKTFGKLHTARVYCGEDPTLIYFEEYFDNAGFLTDGEVFYDFDADTLLEEVERFGEISASIFGDRIVVNIDSVYLEPNFAMDESIKNHLLRLNEQKASDIENEEIVCEIIE